MQPGPFEILDHTADVAIRAYGRTLPELFENAALAMFSTMVDLKSVPGSETRHISVSAPSLEDLLVSWLREFIFISDTEHLVFSRFSIQQLTEPTDEREADLSGIATGGPYQAGVVRMGAAVKAVTYHDLRIERTPEGVWQAVITFDV